MHARGCRAGRAGSPAAAAAAAGKACCGKAPHLLLLLQAGDLKAKFKSYSKVFFQRVLRF